MGACRRDLGPGNERTTAALQVFTLLMLRGEDLHRRTEGSEYLARPAPTAILAGSSGS